MIQDNVYVILARPFTADNIGAVARAMKNTGFKNIRIISPRPQWKRRAEVMARSAFDLLEKAEIFDNIEDAVSDLNLTIGTTRREGNHRGVFMEFDEAMGEVQKTSKSSKIGLVFGRESKGMNNEETDACDVLMTIPSHPDYPSLNLAQSVMVILFQLSKDMLAKGKKQSKMRPARFLNKSEIKKSIKHFEKALDALKFSRGERGKVERIIKVTEAIFKRTGMLEREAQMLKGVSRRICERVKD